MRLSSFRIQHFRSILDTNWVDFSPDNLTTIIGQNEAGKTVFLDALYSFFTKTFSPDDFCLDFYGENNQPIIECSFTQENLVDVLPPNYADDIKNTILEKQRINIGVKRLPNGEIISYLENQEFHDLKDRVSNTEDNTPEENLSEEEQALQVNLQRITDFETEILTIFEREKPSFVIFKDYSSILPSKIYLDEIQNDTIAGSQGVRDLLDVAKVTIDQLNSTHQDKNKMATLTETISKDITTELNKSWRQYFSDDLAIDIEIDSDHESTENNTPGRPYLSFFIRNKNKHRLAFNQRSNGLKWFISFFLFMKAVYSRGGSILMLIDEPGSLLHSNAKRDTYLFFESISIQFQIIFTTHYSEFISLKHPYRLLIAEKNSNNFTEIDNYSKISANKIESIQPILQAIGMSIQHATGLITDKNVLLEEASALYYLLALKSIFGNTTEKYSFIPCHGANNVSLVAGILLGWGIDYVLYIDNDKKGNEVKKEISKYLFGNNDILIKKHIAETSVEGSIEDFFSSRDFESHVLPQDLREEFKTYKRSYDGKTLNSSFLKKMGDLNKASKISIAVNFYLRNKETSIPINNTTKGNFKKIFLKVEELLFAE